MNTFKFFGCILFFCVGLFSAQEKVYFDSLWAVTSKDKAVYYRETSHEKELTRIKDFYKNGTLQMEGLASDTTPNYEVFEGKVTWYYPNGKIQMVNTYSKGMPIGEQKSYDEKGRIVSDLFYQNAEKYSGTTYIYDDCNEEDNDYSTTGNLITYYKDGNITKTINFDKDWQKGIRSETIYQENYTPKEVLYYNEKNKLIGKLNYDANSYMTTGTEVSFFYHPMRIRLISKKVKKGESTEEVSWQEFYPNGKLKIEYSKTNDKTAKTLYYNNQKKLIGELEHRITPESSYLIPYNGTEIIFFETKTDAEKIQNLNEYKNGLTASAKEFNNKEKLINYIEYDSKTGYPAKRTQYNDDGVQTAQLIYQDGNPYEGVQTEPFAEYLYKNGKLTSLKKYYEAPKTLHYEKTLLPDEKNYDIKVYEKDKSIKYQFLSPFDTHEQFTSSVKIYEKGKHKETVEFKDGVLTKGKIKLSNYYSGFDEFERQGNWLIKRTYNTKNELIKEFKEKITSEDYNPENIFYESRFYEIYDTNEYIITDATK